MAGTAKTQLETLQIDYAQEQGDEHAVVVAAGQRRVEGGHGGGRVVRGGRQLLDQADGPGHEQRGGYALVRDVPYRNEQLLAAPVIAVQIATHRARGQHPRPQPKCGIGLAGLAAVGQHRHLYFPGGAQFTLQPAAPGGGGFQVGDIGFQVLFHGCERLDQPGDFIVARGCRQRRIEVTPGDAIAGQSQRCQRPGEPSGNNDDGGGHQQQGQQARQGCLGFELAQGSGQLVLRVHHADRPAGGCERAHADNTAARYVGAGQSPGDHAALQGSVKHRCPGGLIQLGSYRL